MGGLKETEMAGESPYYDENRNTSLHLAASRGNTKDVNSCLGCFKKIDAENCLGWTPLMMATRNGHFETVKLLINAKANATKTNYFGFSVFVMACANGNLEIIECLLQHLLNGGVSRTIIESTISPISLAILFKHDHIVQHLIAKGFNINAEAAFTGVTPLMYAGSMKNSSIFNILISHGANLYAKNINQKSAQDITDQHNRSKRPSLRLHIPPTTSTTTTTTQQQQTYNQTQPQCSQYYQHVPSPQIRPYNMPSPVVFVSSQPVLMPVPPQYSPVPPQYPTVSPQYSTVPPPPPPPHSLPLPYNPVRKSSNVASPMFLSPGVSPIYYSADQVFFPQDFNYNMNQWYPTVGGFCYGINNQVFDQISPRF